MQIAVTSDGTARGTAAVNLDTGQPLEVEGWADEVGGRFRATIVMPEGPDHAVVSGVLGLIIRGLVAAWPGRRRPHRDCRSHSTR